MTTYADAIKMTPEELHDHPEVEQCACAHARGLHTYGRKSRHQCKGRYTDGSVNMPCDCTEFRSTGLRMKNSLISLPIESRADVEVNPAVTQYRKLFSSEEYGGGTQMITNVEYGSPGVDATLAERLEYIQGVLSKIWSILADGQRALDPDADPEYDTNNLYDLVREGVEAKKKLAEGEREIAKFLDGRMEEAVVELDVTLKAASDAVESCAKTAEEYDDRVCCDGSCGTMIAALIRNG